MTPRPVPRPHRAPTRTRRAVGLLVAGALALSTAAVLGTSPSPVAAAPGTGTGANGQTLTVSDVDLLDPHGTTVTVSGAGFDAAAGFDVEEHGLYLSLCVETSPTEQTSPCLGGIDETGETATTRWVTNNPIGDAAAVPIAADGSFTTTLDVDPTDAFTDCLTLSVGQCKIIVRRDHRAGGDRSQDVRVPVTWATGTAHLSVTPITGLDAAGTHLLVTGTGYPTDGPGLYVVYGPEVPSTSSVGSAQPYQRAAYVTAGQLVASGGSFSVTLSNVTARYTDGTGTSRDFLDGGGFVSTFRAQGQADPDHVWRRSQGVWFARRSATQSFVAAALADFLGRPGTTEEIAAGVAAIDGGQSRAQFLRALSTSDEWLESVVDQLYLNTLGREGDASGTAFWVGELKSGRRSVAKVAAQFYASGEYFDGLGGGTNPTWIDDLYTKILGRSADDGGRAFWVSETVAKGRGNVALRFYQSGESARTRVQGLYRQLLGRSAEPDGLAHWAPRVVREGDLALAVYLAGSAEYLSRSATRYP